MSKPGLVLDTGALIAYEATDRRIRLLLTTALEAGAPVLVPAGVVAQVWRGGARQALLALLLNDERVSVVDLDRRTAQAVGELVRRSGHPDVIDVSVVLCAKLADHTVVTSDPGDMRKVSSSIRLIEC